MKTFGITKESLGQLTEKRSRFLCHLLPCTSPEQARELLHKLKQEHPKARHVCLAWIGEDNNSYICDDGEPSGCAGKPMLSVLTGAGLVNSAALCIRYFGGTLLGTGGLTRAYRGACEKALSEATLCELSRMLILELSVSYSDHERIEHTVTSVGGVILKADYSNDVILLCALPQDTSESLEQLFSQIPYKTLGYQMVPKAI